MFSIHRGPKQFEMMSKFQMWVQLKVYARVGRDALPVYNITIWILLWLCKYLKLVSVCQRY